jgi:hypothetical protein
VVLLQQRLFQLAGLLLWIGFFQPVQAHADPRVAGVAALQFNHAVGGHIFVVQQAADGCARAESLQQRGPLAIGTGQFDISAPGVSVDVSTQVQHRALGAAKQLKFGVMAVAMVERLFGIGRRPPAVVCTRDAAVFQG